MSELGVTPKLAPGPGHAQRFSASQWRASRVRVEEVGEAEIAELTEERVVLRPLSGAAWTALTPHVVVVANALVEGQWEWMLASVVDLALPDAVVLGPPRFERGNRRASPRVPVEGPATIGWVDSAGVHEIRGRLVDVSENGLAVSLDEPFPEPGVVAVRFQHDRLAVTTVARCVDITPAGLVRLSFAGLPERVREQLAVIVRSRVPRGSEWADEVADAVGQKVPAWLWCSAGGGLAGEAELTPLGAHVAGLETLPRRGEEVTLSVSLGYRRLMRNAHVVSLARGVARLTCS